MYMYICICIYIYTYIHVHTYIIYLHLECLQLVANSRRQGAAALVQRYYLSIYSSIYLSI